jgi:hypothetical protein
MNGFSPRQHVELDQTISAHESQTADDLATIRLLEQQWEEYRQVMREHTARFEESSIGMGTQNYFVQKGLAARKELDTFVGQLAEEQEELLAETARGIRSKSETELERLRREKAGASWG